MGRKTRGTRVGLSLAVILAVVLWSLPLMALDGVGGFQRFYFSGDGRIKLYSERTEKSFSGVYRKGPGIYDKKALAQICRVFGAPHTPSSMALSLRLVEYLDYLEDHFNPGAQVTLTSGYRNPEYNTGLREKGNLAAKASLHQYGMAADLKIHGVGAKTLWTYIKDLKFGGAGFYHGETIHVDVGPARYWDETTSGVGTGISDDNKLIGLVSDYDVYQPGMPLTLRFIRMTAFPVHVRTEFFLLRQNDQGEFETTLDFTPDFAKAGRGTCRGFGSIEDMDRIRWVLPKDLKPGRYTVQALFCDEAWPDMPAQVRTPVFEIKGF